MRYGESKRRMTGRVRTPASGMISRKMEIGDVMGMLQDLGVAKGPERSIIVNRLRQWKDWEMDTNFVRDFLADKGILPSSSRDELFECLLYCIWDEDEEMLRELLFTENR